MMSTDDRDRWNRKYSQRLPPSDTEADQWLVEACQLIDQCVTERRPIGRAVDLACGLGHNSIWLARQGWRVDGVDISDTGLAQAQLRSDQANVVVNWQQADLDEWIPPPDEYDLAIVFRFLDRETVPRIISTGLRAGGWLIYETFAFGQLDRPGNHLRNPAYTLAPGELPQLFPDFEIVEFREEVLDDRTVQRLLARFR